MRCCDILYLIMSVAVLLNLSDGLILGVDSAVTVFSGSDVSKVFEDSDKLFQLGSLKVGIATYGVAGLEGRTIGSFIRQFERDNHTQLPAMPLREIVEKLREFFLAVYIRFAQQVFQLPFDQIPAENKGALGLIVGGFSPDAFLSEVWEVVVPVHDTAYSAREIYKPGEYGSAWFATSEPIQRYIKGSAPNLVYDIVAFTQKVAGRNLTQAEIDELVAVMRGYEYPTKIDGMPIRAGMDYVRFLVNLAINHYRFAATHPIVGGKAKLGVVTYAQESFQILE